MRPFDHPGRYETRTQFFRNWSNVSTESGEHRVHGVPVFTTWAASEDLGSGTVADADGEIEARLFRITYRKTPYLSREENIPCIGWFILFRGETLRVEAVQALDSYEITVTARAIDGTAITW